MTALHQRAEFVLTDDASRLDLVRVHAWLSNEAYWALGRSLDTVRQAFGKSRSYGLYREAEQLGVARIVTDGTTFAWICDVFIDSSVRGQGLGHWMMSTIVSDLTDEGLPRMLLATRDAHGVYADVGFEPLMYPERWMEIDKRPNRHTLAQT